MALGLPAAGLLAGGSVLGGVLGGKGAKKAAKTAQKTAQMQIAEAQRREGVLTAMYQPTIDRGNNAGGLIGSFLGLEGGDRAAEALGQYRASTGYQDLLNTGLGAVNASAYARGMGASGATLKALQTRGQNIADQNAGQWLNGLQYLNNAGIQGINGIAGVSNNTMGVINQANQSAGDAQANAALYSAGNWGNALQNIANIGAGYLGGGFGAKTGSSYTPMMAAGAAPSVVSPFATGYGLLGGAGRR